MSHIMFNIDWSNMFSDRSNVHDTLIEDVVYGGHFRDAQQRRNRSGKLITAIKA